MSEPQNEIEAADGGSALTTELGLEFDEADYLRFDPCEGDEGEITYRTVKLVRARKEHACFMGAGHYGDGHTIKPGDLYRNEKALVDGDFWGQYRVCVPCLNKWLHEIHGDEDAA